MVTKKRNKSVMESYNERLAVKANTQQEQNTKRLAYARKQRKR